MGLFQFFTNQIEISILSKFNIATSVVKETFFLLNETMDQCPMPSQYQLAATLYRHCCRKWRRKAESRNKYIM